MLWEDYTARRALSSRAINRGTGVKKRVLFAGLYHETNTFLEGHTPASAFKILRGREMLSARGDATPLGGALAEAEKRGWVVVPSLDMRANPSATVEDAAVELFWSEFSARGSFSELDAIFLVLHGAMVSESCDDVEGEILSRIRASRGAGELLIGGVMDLHANFTARMAQNSDAQIAYRTNPHIDARSAAEDAVAILDRIIESGKKPATVREHPPVIWPPAGTDTSVDPMRTLEAMARKIERERPEILAVNVLAGFALADTPETGVSFTAITTGDISEAKSALAELSRWAFDHRALGDVQAKPIEEVMSRLREHARGPILLVEPSDNIGAGAPGDGTGVLRALVKHRVNNAAVVINDADAVARISRLPVGSRVTVPIGGKGSRLDAGPVELDVELLSTSDGRFELEDKRSHLASMTGEQIDMGPCAVVRHEGVRILLTSRPTPPFDLGQFRSQGIEPKSLFVIGVKAAVAHRQAYDPIAVASYFVDTPGPCSMNVKSLPYRKVRTNQVSES